MKLADTYRRQLHGLADVAYGFVTVEQAKRLGVPAVELRKLAQRGGLEHVGYGLYRFEDAPRTKYDQFMEAVLRVGPDAHLTQDAVLALHGLAFVNPRRIRVGTSRRCRTRVPSYVEIVQESLPPEDLTSYEGVPSATVARAIEDARWTVIDERLADAVQEAERSGLLLPNEARRLEAQLANAA